MNSVSRYIRTIFPANQRCTYSLTMQNDHFLLKSSLYIDNILQRQICRQDMFVRGLAMEGHTRGVLTSLTVHPRLLQFLSQYIQSIWRERERIKLHSQKAFKGKTAITYTTLYHSPIMILTV